MAAQGFDVDPDQILITFGSQQGIDIAARLMLDRGDPLAAEGPTYIGALQAFDAYEPDYRLYPVDQAGLRVDELIADVERTGRAPKLIYVIPNFQNPTGLTMSGERRATAGRLRGGGRRVDRRGRSLRRVLVRHAAAARLARTLSDRSPISARSPRRSRRACGPAGWSCRRA